MVRRNPVQQVGQARRRVPIQERRGARTSRPAVLPSPVGGWNARDALSEMDARDAVRLRNWFPRQSDVITRPGFSQHCATGESSSEVRQLIPFEYGAYSQMLAAVNGKIFNVTTSTPSSLVTGLTGNDWSYDYLGGLVLMCNGADVVKSWNGAAIASPAFTGPTLTDLNHVAIYKSRAYFVEKNSQSMWYGGTGAVTGALTEFDFSTVASIRGNLMFTTHLKGDGGDGGADDIFLAIFAGGDVIAYMGSDPGDSANWQLVGHYHIGRPLGRLAYVRADDDVYVATNRGHAKLSELSKFGDTAPEKLLISNKIQQAVSDDIASVGESINWRLVVYTKGQMLIVTSPLTGTARRYHVQNINTKNWAEFDGFIAHSWATLGGALYFGGDAGKVYAFDNGSTSDAGTTIRADCQQAWSSLGAPGLNKQVQLIKPFLYGLIDPSVSVNVAADYEQISLASFSNEGANNSAIWDQGIWDQAIWDTGERTFKTWYSRNATGEAIGLRIAVDAPAARVRWNQTTVVFTMGGLL
jgi:hypothetical protein